MEFKSILKEKLQKYIEQNLQYERLNETLQCLKKEKNTMETDIIEFMNENNASNNIFVLDSFKIQYKSSTQYQNLSNKFVQQCIQEYCNIKSISLNIEDLMNYIKDKRDKKEKQELKMFNV